METNRQKHNGRHSPREWDTPAGYPTSSARDARQTSARNRAFKPGLGRSSAWANFDTKVSRPGDPTWWSDTERLRTPALAAMDRRFAYVRQARTRYPGAYRAVVLKPLIREVAAQIEDPTPPHWRTVVRWVRQLDPPKVKRLAPPRASFLSLEGAAELVRQAAMHHNREVITSSHWLGNTVVRAEFDRYTGLILGFRIE